MWNHWERSSFFFFLQIRRRRKFSFSRERRYNEGLLKLVNNKKHECINASMQ